MSGFNEEFKRLYSQEPTKPKDEQALELAKMAMHKAEAIELAVTDAICIISNNLPHLRTDIVESLRIHAECNQNEPDRYEAITQLASLLESVEIQVKQKPSL